ncbi:hypothetical protein [Pedobacter foliorum]|uniref:hypothetical protein n=1 Tax=Pedobacter foliorum TaxID=2739058 RepID=UPI0015632CC5|nr:hypothetical protein [Pedobacter foliorum]NRF41123.1 hypothetical protein [Pedobacter foliorum]
MKKIGIILFIISFCIMMLILFFQRSQQNTRNAFNRKLIAQKFRLSRVFQFPDPGFGFAWKPDSMIYLKDYNNATMQYVIDPVRGHVRKIKLVVPIKFNKQGGNVNFDRWDTTVHMTNGIGEIAAMSSSRNQFWKLSGKSFDEPRSFSGNTLVVRSFVKNKLENRLELLKISLAQQASPGQYYDLPPQVDGIFCADGWLHYDAKAARLYYMYFYRGTFLCLDTNLNLRYKAKTIDTVQWAKIRVNMYNQRLKNGGAILRKSPAGLPTMVNKYFTVSGNRVYIQSGLKADNESASSRRKQESIDVYEGNSGRYIYSFYLPKYQGLNVRQFEVTDHNLIAIYDKFLVIYRMG